jgi:hypothetical protein
VNFNNLLADTKYTRKIMSPETDLISVQSGVSTKEISIEEFLCKKLREKL